MNTYEFIVLLFLSVFIPLVETTQKCFTEACSCKKLSKTGILIITCLKSQFPTVSADYIGIFTSANVLNVYGSGKKEENCEKSWNTWVTLNYNFPYLTQVNLQNCSCCTEFGENWSFKSEFKIKCVPKKFCQKEKEDEKDEEIWTVLDWILTVLGLGGGGVIVVVIRKLHSSGCLWSTWTFFKRTIRWNNVENNLVDRELVELAAETRAQDLLEDETTSIKTEV